MLQCCKSWEIDGQVKSLIPNSAFLGVYTTSKWLGLVMYQLRDVSFRERGGEWFEMAFGDMSLGGAGEGAAHQKFV